MNIEFSVGFGKDAGNVASDHDHNILIVGNFSGQSRDSAIAAEHGVLREFFRLDLLETDAAIARIRPRLQLALSGGEDNIEFSSLDGFHPDCIVSEVPAFSAFFALKQSLKDPSKTESAALLARKLLGHPETPATSANLSDAKVAETAAENEGDMFARLLGQPASKSTPGNPTARAAVARLLRDSGIEKDIAPTTVPDATALAAGIDDLCTAALRELLHSPQFQALESSWRSVSWLGERLETDAGISAWLADIGAGRVADWSAAICERIRQSVGSVDLIILLEEFSTSEESFTDVAALAGLAAELGTPIFAGATADLAGANVDLRGMTALDGSHLNAEQPEAWRKLRALPGAALVGLGFPRFLLRQPYGRQSDPTEKLDFEELQSRPAHDEFLWANAATCLAAMFLMREDRIPDLPMVVFDDGSGQAIKPVSEVYLAESAIDILIKRGLVPIVGNRGGTDIRIVRMQSIAATPTAI